MNSVFCILQQPANRCTPIKVLYVAIKHFTSYTFRRSNFSISEWFNTWSAQYSLHTAWQFPIACLWLVSRQDCWQCNDTCPPTLPLCLWNLFGSLGTGRCKQQTTNSSCTVSWNIPLKGCKSRKLPVSVKSIGLLKYRLISQIQF